MEDKSMPKIRFSFQKSTFAANEDGASLVEYSLLVALIALVSIAAVTGTGSSVNTAFGTINSYLQNAVK
jgi:pilus assembly protein Flp/PilA